MRKVEMNEMIMVDAGKFSFGNGEFGIFGNVISFGVKVAENGDHTFICKLGGESGIGLQYTYIPFASIESDTALLSPIGIVKTVIALVGSIFS